jgi:phosphatidylglycerophosphate synthase
LKYPFRKMIQGLLPYFKHANPNWVSFWLIPIGVVTALTYAFAPSFPIAYWLGIALIILRMVIGTMDGLIAVTYHKETARGEMINRITPEIADILLMLGIIFSNSDYYFVGVLALAACWATTFSGLIGVVANRKIQSVGPVGQTDRIAALILFSLLQYFSLVFGFGIDFIWLFLWWCVIGGFATAALRLYRIL